MSQKQAAAKWWTDLLRQGAKWDSGDALCNTEHALIVEMFLKLPAPTEAQLKIFQDELQASLQVPSEIHIDYHAPDVLMDAAKVAGIKGDDMTLFGCKISMWINLNLVEVQHGYGARIETVWKS